MSILIEIKEKMEGHLGLKIESYDNSISVTPENGFTVWLVDNNNSYTVGFEGWHEEFNEKEEALNCFGWGLSKACRLKVVSRGSKAHKWTIQSLENGKWVNGSTTGLIFFKFWVKPSIEYKQNSIEHS